MENLKETEGTRHILGMAKSSLDLKGAKRQKLELDFLRLVYAVKELRSKGDQAKGYLLVMTEDIAKTTGPWIHKYQAGDTVVIAVANLSPGDQEELQIEKGNNVAGMIAGSLGNTVGSQSNAVLGKQLGERALRRHIMSKEPKVQEITNETVFPLGIRWDFYGQSEISQS